MNGFVSDANEILNLLNETKNLINEPNFNIDENFLFKEVRNTDDGNHPKNKETLLELGYDASDVLNEICSLTLQNYYQTVPDIKVSGSYLYIFIKTIQAKQVYIKYKIKVVKNKKIVCLSFHFVEYEVKLSELPYNSICY